MANELNIEKQKNIILTNELNIEKQKNTKLTEEFNYYLNIIKNLKLKNKILELDLNSKIIEIENLQNKLNELPSKLDNSRAGGIINLYILSFDENIIFPISCNNNTIFVELEKEFYNEYPEYKKLNPYFTANGLVIERLKSIQENNIKNHDKIVLNTNE